MIQWKALNGTDMAADIAQFLWADEVDIRGMHMHSGRIALSPESIEGWFQFRDRVTPNSTHRWDLLGLLGSLIGVTCNSSRESPAFCSEVGHHVHIFMYPSRGLSTCAFDPKDAIYLICSPFMGHLAFGHCLVCWGLLYSVSSVPPHWFHYFWLCASARVRFRF